MGGKVSKRTRGMMVEPGLLSVTAPNHWATRLTPKGRELQPSPVLSFSQLPFDSVPTSTGITGKTTPSSPRLCISGIAFCGVEGMGRLITGAVLASLKGSN